MLGVNGFAFASSEEKCTLSCTRILTVEKDQWAFADGLDATHGRGNSSDRPSLAVLWRPSKVTVLFYNEFISHFSAFCELFSLQEQNSLLQGLLLCTFPLDPYRSRAYLALARECVSCSFLSSPWFNLEGLTRVYLILVSIPNGLVFPEHHRGDGLKLMKSVIVNDF